MNCKKYSNLICELVEGELDAQTAEEVSTHIFSCAVCEAEFENQNREKEIYSQFLFEIEPPKDLAQRFHARLKDEIETETAKLKTPLTISGKIANLFAIWNLTPIAVSACVLLAIISGYIWLKNPSDKSEDTAALQNKTANSLSLAKSVNEEILQTESKNNPDEIANPNLPQTVKKVYPIKTKSVEAKIVKTKTQSENKNLIRFVRSQNPIEKPDVTEEDKLRISEIQTFEIETAKQFEKIELMLRSFRNARFSEDTGEYDVAYEKRQARRLLGKNVLLRHQAEIYGADYVAEMFNKVEPFLLDIANLEDDTSSAEKVLDIKQRVRDQNLIAGLQIF